MFSNLDVAVDESPWAVPTALDGVTGLAPLGLGWSCGPCLGEDGLHRRPTMALEQLKTFLVRMQDDPDLKARVLAAATADDVAKIAAGLGYEFAGDELLRFSGQKVGRVTVSKQETPGEYN